MNNIFITLTFIISNKDNLEFLMQIIPKLCLQSENRNTDLEPLANANGKKDGNTSLDSSRNVRDMGRVERLEVIEKKTWTRAVCLSQQFYN